MKTNKSNAVHFLLTSVILVISLFCGNLKAQDRTELVTGWKCKSIAEIDFEGIELSDPALPLIDWEPAVVPGTVLTTLLENGDIPDPFYGMNNEEIPDIYDVGKEYYTYWFVNDFYESLPEKGEELWLHLRGVNYSCDVFLNGVRLNKNTHKGMFLRQTYNITKLVNSNGANRLAIVVFPADHVGNPNGGQAGDGTIGKNVGHQYAAGWDWIQPIRDRNTGIWDKVWVEKTRSVNLKNPHIITSVSGKRNQGANQQPALIKASVELENTSAKKIKGILKYDLDGHTVKTNVTLEPNDSKMVALPEFKLQNPSLWWPHGYGEQHLYDMNIQFLIDGKVLSDEEKLKIGVREIEQKWNDHTRSMQVFVNGQSIFIKGGNWIISDAMLRFSPERYDSEVRFHRDMNLNLIRIWGGAITERPEFYEACDKYGMLVIQDFWVSGDANGRWMDDKKLEDQWTRRKYPDDHNLFLTSASDMIKMIRNHASLAMWCGGNEITPPEDILTPLMEDILPELDGTRTFITYSNSDSMSYNSIGGNGDGPYTIQPISRFWQERTFPFNSEVGSVGVGDYESLERFIPEQNMIPPKYPSPVDSVWKYHKYIGYNEHIRPYGEPVDIHDFSEKAQLVNYDQYRALAEGFSAHMWDWYTGYIIWKTQNPWTALRGQMYDYYLDPNASLYGLNHGNESLHVMYNPIEKKVLIANNGVQVQRDMMLRVETYDMAGRDSLLTQVLVYANPGSAKPIFSIEEFVNEASKEAGAFLRLQLLSQDQKILSENFYWLPDSSGVYSGLQSFSPPKVQVEAYRKGSGQVEVTISNPLQQRVAFFNRVSLVGSETKKRILPVFYSDNYVSIPPGESKTIMVEYESELLDDLLVSVKGWNSDERFFSIK